MNQILYEDVGEKKTDIKKIQLVLGIILILFGIVLVVIGIFGMINRSSSSAVPLDNGTRPSLEVSLFGEDKVKIKVTHDKAINRIEYRWNNEEEKVLLGRERLSFEELIDAPVRN